MLTEQRKLLLIDKLRRDGRLVAKALSVELQVSEDTIRRDLRELAVEGHLRRVHGGALPIAVSNIPLHARKTIDSGEKDRLAKSAAVLVTPGSTCFIDGGSTHEQLLEHLPSDLRATIVTHSPTIAAATERFEHIRCLLIGGTLYRNSMVALGPAAHISLAAMTFDLAFIGVNGFHLDYGMTVDHHDEAHFKAAAAARARKVIVVLTSAKIGTVSPFLALKTENIDKIVMLATDYLPASMPDIQVVKA